MLSTSLFRERYCSLIRRTIYIYIYIYIYINIYVYICIYIYICIYVCIYAYQAGFDKILRNILAEGRKFDSFTKTCS